MSLADTGVAVAGYAEADLRNRIGAVLGDRMEARVEVDSLSELAGGASRRTWGVGLLVDGAAVDVVAQVTGTQAADLLSMTAQAAVIGRARAAGVSAPEVLHADDGVDGEPPLLIMRRALGEAVPTKVLRSEGLAEARSRLAADCGATLAKLHSIAEPGVPGLVERGSIEDARDRLDDLEDTRPAFELALAWLGQHRPSPPPRPCLVHGDFRLGNLVVDVGGLVAVLDWELAHLGEPGEDLGFLCVRSWRFGGSSPVGGFGSYEALLESYNQASGTDIDLGTLRWWEVLGTLRWGVICLAQRRKHLDRSERSIELAAIGRRVSEVEHDLMVLLP